MSGQPAAENVRPDQTTSSWRSELFWLVPVALGLLSITVLLLANLSWGADVAGVLALPISVVAIVLSILIERDAFPKLRSMLPQPKRLKRAATYTVTALIIAGGAIYWTQREPDPYDFLSGKVRIGYFETERYPGWHEEDYSRRRGFDVNVARAIQEHFGFEIEWVPLDTRDQRLAALGGKWDGRDPVKLVISNFSTTPKRQRMIDFAGPYFIDTVGFLTHSYEQHLADVPIGSVCVPQGATASEKLIGLGWRPIQASLEECIHMFKSGNPPDLAVSTDLAILEAYASRHSLSERPRDFTLGTEKYGIGIPNNSPKLCAAINKALSDFLQHQWESAFAENLSRLGLSQRNRRPPSTSDCEPPVSWWPSG